jgi:hypothetical protein
MAPLKPPQSTLSDDGGQEKKKMLLWVASKNEGVVRWFII